MVEQMDYPSLADAIAIHGETAWLDCDSDQRPIQGVRPRLVCAPGTAEALAAALASCDGAGAAVIPWGSGSQQSLGNPPQRADVVIDTQRLNRLVEWEPANLTATVEAGMRFADFQEALAGHNQWLPLDPPLPETATVGGLIATNTSGPRRLRDGALRDLVIGTRVANVDGTVTRAGGRVVKNVTGYDLNKLHIGALGTLGVIVEVTVKVAPRPEVERTWFGLFPSAAEAAAMVAAIARTSLTPTALAIVNGPLATDLQVKIPDGKWLVLARASGFRPTVERHLREFEAQAKAAGAEEAQTLGDDLGKGLWQRYAASARERRWSGESLTLRLAVPPVALGRLCARLSTSGEEPVIWAEASGAVFWSIGAMQAQADQVTALRNLAAEWGGAAIMENKPPALRSLDPWGPAAGPLAAMRAIKNQYDPRGTLNPGRFVGGI
jgi:glycolate oxidase FAD binding subunit